MSHPQDRRFAVAESPYTHSQTKARHGAEREKAVHFLCPTAAASRVHAAGAPVPAAMGLLSCRIPAVAKVGAPRKRAAAGAALGCAAGKLKARRSPGLRNPALACAMCAMMTKTSRAGLAPAGAACSADDLV